MAGHQNHAANAAAWAAMRAAEAEERAAYIEQRRAEKAARRAANRAAWWGRMSREVPAAEPVAVPEPEPEPEPVAVPVARQEPETALEPETAPEPVAVAQQEPEPEPVAVPVAPLSGFDINEPSQGAGDVVTLSKDGLQYAIVYECGAFTVELPNGEELQAPTYETAEELVSMAHETALAEAEELPKFERGMTFAIGSESYTIEGVGCTVKYRNARPGSKKHETVRRITERGECITLSGNRKHKRFIYAADIAA